MPRPTLDRPPTFHLAQREPGHLTLASDCAAVAHVFVPEEDIVRVLVLPDGQSKQPRTWAIAPGLEDVPADGRDRMDLSGFRRPEFEVVESPGTLVICTGRIQLTIMLTGFKCQWEVFDIEWKIAARDRSTQAYDFGWWDGRVRHYLERSPEEAFFGLGERSGEQNRAGRRFRMCNIDALGYSARTSDPLYKHIPFSITRRPWAGLCYGLYYDTLSDCVFDLGCERDNYHGLYRTFEADHGDLDYYFIAGPHLADIVRRFTWMTGRPALPPAWSWGFSGSSMAVADAPDAEAKILDYLDQCAQRGLPCPSFHLSSGYTESEGRRRVFVWNREKFLDPARFAHACAERGARLIANVKPAMLSDHPMFDEASSAGLFMSDATGEPCLAQFWNGLGAWLDFTNPTTRAWWKAKVTKTLLEMGVTATWNDNNEFEIWSPLGLAHGTGEPAMYSRALQPLLMMRASREAQIAHAPDRRAFLVSRSGCVGMQRYAQTWSGDNETSWESLQYNLKMGLGLALSGISNSGHDVGGFSGPPPDAELFARWVGFGVFNPRFSVHSWNDDGSVNTPWMHEAVAEAVRALFALRTRYLPYFRYLSWRYARDFEPMWRPTFFDFPGDGECWNEGDNFMLGPSLLIAPVVEPGASHRMVRLPLGADWFDVWTGEQWRGGESIECPAPFDRPPHFARAGALVPVENGFLLFPLANGAFSLDLFADDGETPVDVAAAQIAARITVTCDRDAIRIDVEGDRSLASGAFELPAGELRPLIRH